MNRRGMFVAIAVLIFCAGFGNAFGQFILRSIKLTNWFGPPKQDLFSIPFRANHNIQIEWKITNPKGDEKLNIRLIDKNGAVKHSIASGVASQWPKVTDPKGGDTFAMGSFGWTPAQDDVGCHYRIMVYTTDNALSIFGNRFNIYPAFSFKQSDHESFARIDTALAGSSLILDSDLVIKWTAIPVSSNFASGKADFELMANVNGAWTKVGLIATSYIDFNGCMISNYFLWKVGTLASVYEPASKPNGKNGLKYRIRVTCKPNSYWDTGDFLITKEQIKKKTINKLNIK